MKRYFSYVMVIANIFLWVTLLRVGWRNLYQKLCHFFSFKRVCIASRGTHMTVINWGHLLQNPLFPDNLFPLLFPPCLELSLGHDGSTCSHLAMLLICIRTTKTYNVVTSNDESVSPSVTLAMHIDNEYYSLHVPKGLNRIACSKFYL